MDFSRLDIEVSVAKCNDAAKILLDAFQLE
jgi:hypothetical protein